MKRTALVLTISIVTLGVAYFAYTQWPKSNGLSPWDLVPENAAIVYESNSPINTWNKLLKSSLWESLEDIEQFNKLNQGLEILDSLGGKSGRFSELLNNQFLVSIHKTSKNTFDFLWIIDLSDSRKQQTAFRILEKAQSEAKFKLLKRNYLDFEIQELVNDSLGKEFSYLLHDNKLIASQTSFLVEDVARLINNTGGFRNKNPGLFELPKLSKDEGNLYVNASNAAQLLGLFVDGQKNGGLSKLKHVSKSMFFDLSIQSNGMLLNGFSLSNDNSFLNTFKGQKPGKSPFRYYIPERTSVFYEFLFDDAEMWYNRLEKYWKEYNPSYLNDRKEQLDKLSFDFSKALMWLNNGVSFLEMDPVSGSDNDLLVFISPKDLNEGLAQLNTLSEALARNKGDTAYTEAYAGLQIRELDVKEFPRSLFGPIFSGFEKTYFASVDGMIVFGNTIESIKNLISDIQSENTWGRSVKYNQFFGDNLEEYNLNVSINTRKLWTKVLSQLDEDWHAFANQNTNQLRSFHLASVQFSALDENYYASIAVDHEKQTPLAKDKGYTLDQEVYVGRKILSKPNIVKNHVTNDLEVALQDSAMHLILISSKGKELWRIPLEERIVSDIKQIDFYKNGKLQLFFATASKVHLIDRLGNYVENYPVEISGYSITQASVLDYDRSKNYRFLLTDNKRNLLLMNKQGVLLEGWNPNKLSGRMINQPFHLRVRGKDVIVALQENGVVNVMNRRGQMLTGFPLEIGGRISGDAFVRKGGDFSGTTLSVVSDDGMLTKFNLEGDILSAEQLYRPTANTKFTLIPDALGKSYIVASKDDNRLVLMNEIKEDILSKDYLSDGIKKIQFYDFSDENKIYVVNDENQGFSYLYDKDGILVNSQPFNSDTEVAVMFFESKMEYKIYLVAEESLNVISF